MVMRVVPSDSWKVMRAVVRSEEGGGWLEGKVRKTKVEGWRVVVRVVRRVVRELSPVAVAVELITRPYEGRLL